MRSLEEHRIRQYLLGTLSPKRTERLEEQLLREEDFAERLSLIEDELIEDYARGALNARERKQFETHFLSIPRRRRKLKMVRELRKYASVGKTSVAEPSWFQKVLMPQWRAFAAAALVVVAGIGVWQMLPPSNVQKGLLALNEAYRTQRTVESRVTGLEYARYSPTRGSEGVDSRALDRSAALLQNAVNDDRSAEALHALGRLYLMRKEFDKAIAEFEEALKKTPNDSQLHSDLGAALFEKGKFERTTDASGRSETTLARSLEHLTRALELDNSLLEARFNRALLYEQLKLVPQALEDWEKYVSLDPNSQWTTEARERIEAIRKQGEKVSSRDASLFDEFVQARMSGDEEKAWRVFNRAHLRNGNAITNKLIDNYLDAVTNERKHEAEEALQALTHLARLSSDKTQDRFTSDLVNVYGSATPTRLKTLVQARKDVANAYAFFEQSKHDRAVELYGSARDLFAQAGDRPEALLAHFWMGFCQSQRGDGSEKTLPILNHVEDQSDALSYKWLQSITQIGLANVYSRVTKYSKAIEEGWASYKISNQTEDKNGVLRSLGFLSATYRDIGNYRQALQLAQIGLDLGIEIAADPSQMVPFYATSAWSLNSLGHYNAALEFEKQALRLGDIMDNPLVRSRYWVQMGLIQRMLKNYQEAIRNIQHGIQISQSIGAEKIGVEMATYGRLFLGQAYRQSRQFNEALATLSEVVSFCEQGNEQLWILHEAKKEQLLTRIAQGEITAARQELAQVLDAYEKQREKILEGRNRASFFAKEQGIYDVAIDFALSHLNSPRDAFDYSENSRARSLLDTTTADWRVADQEQVPDLRFSGALRPMPLEEIQRNLPANVQLLQFAVLKDKLVVWYLTNNRFESQTTKIADDELMGKVDRLLSLVSRLPSNGDDDKQLLRAATELYDLLIKPVAQFLDHQKQLCIVGDKILNLVPFNILFSSSSQKYLVEDFVLSYASSATMLIRDTNSARDKAVAEEKLLGVGNPTFNRSAFPDLDDLPSAANEVLNIREFYDSPPMILNGPDARKTSILGAMRQADIVHLATHYLPDQNSPMQSRLLLADTGRSGREHSENGVLHAYEVYGLKPLKARLAILSGCRTGVEEYLDGEGAIGLARPFKAAGVPLVIASLWPVDSKATAELMVNFHRLRRRERLPSAKALRGAQLQMLNNSNPDYRRPYYWASFALTGGFSDY